MRNQIDRSAGRSRSIAALAMGAVALGTMAVGALAIGRLAVGRARIRRMEIGDLLVQRLRVIDKGRPPPSSPSAANSHGIVNLASPYPFPETVSRLQSAFAVVRVRSRILSATCAVVVHIFRPRME